METVTKGREGHGWGPYWIPYISFLLLVELGRRLPDGAQPVMLFVKPLVPLLLLIWYWRQGAYPELRGRRLDFAGSALDVLLGVALAFMWMGPYLFFPSLRPDPSDAFDPTLLGQGGIAVTLGMRMFGYAV